MSRVDLDEAGDVEVAVRGVLRNVSPIDPDAHGYDCSAALRPYSALWSLGRSGCHKVIPMERILDPAIGGGATVGVLHSEGANDRLEINTLAGTDSVDPAGLAAGAIQLFVDGVLVP